MVIFNVNLLFFFNKNVDDVFTRQFDVLVVLDVIQLTQDDVTVFVPQKFPAFLRCAKLEE